MLSHNVGDDSAGQGQDDSQDHGAGAQRGELAKQSRIVEDGEGGRQNQSEDGAVGLDAVLFEQVGDQLGDRIMPEPIRERFITRSGIICLPGTWQMS